MTRLFLLILAIAFAPAMSLRAQQSEPVAGKHVTADLLSDAASVQPGQPFTVAVRLKMDPHWHTYWTNPGDSGQPPSVKWTLPEGFTAGELQFPLPIKFNQPGDIVGYGYEDEVVLLTTISTPRNLPVGTPVEVKANVSWLVCADVCIPGKAALSMSLPVGVTVAPSAHLKLIDEWMAKLPEDREVAGYGSTQWWSVAGAKAGEDADAEIRLSWPTNSPKPTKLEMFFPQLDGVSFSGDTVTVAKDEATIRYVQRRLTGSKIEPVDTAATPHRALVAITGADGVRRGYLMRIPVGGDVAIGGELGPKHALFGQTQ